MTATHVVGIDPESVKSKAVESATWRLVSVRWALCLAFCGTGCVLRPIVATLKGVAFGTSW